MVMKDFYGGCCHRVIENSKLAAKFEYSNNVKTKITAYVSVMSLPKNSVKSSLSNKLLFLM